MGAILYFLPGQSAEQLEHEGLFVCNDLTSSVLADCGNVGRDVVISDSERGPDGGAGAIVYPKLRDGDEPWTYFKPECQTWKELDGMWLGTTTDSLCYAADLMRSGQLYFGYFVASDADGWLIPVATFGGSMAVGLPRDIVFCAEDGKPREVVKARFNELAVIAEKLARHYDGEEDEDAANFEFRLGAAIAALQINYRIGPRELEFLRQIGRPVLDTSVVEAVCQSFAGRVTEPETSHDGNGSSRALEVRDSVT